MSTKFTRRKSILSKLSRCADSSVCRVTEEFERADSSATSQTEESAQDTEEFVHSIKLPCYLLVQELFGQLTLLWVVLHN